MDFAISNPTRLLFPGAGLTKGDVVGYYERIAETMLPHMRGRPLTLHRFPEGIDRPGFYMKEAPAYFPDWIERVMIPVEERGGELQPPNHRQRRRHPALPCQPGHRHPAHLAQPRAPPRAARQNHLGPRPGERDFDAVRQAARHLRPFSKKPASSPSS
jgi:bifunctional non-homologous end joining protein LigD